MIMEMKMKIEEIMRKGNANKKYKMYVDGKYVEECVIDWATVPVDTKLLVSLDGKHWLKRYFAKYEDGEIYCFSGGMSSFSVDDKDNCSRWYCVELYEEN